MATPIKASLKPARAEEADGNLYRIGAVARMTGIALPTLRMWERRYRVVEPNRSEAGGRLYSRTDIERLALLRTVVQSGHAIGSVARLSTEQLRERNQPLASASPAGAGPCRVVVAGAALAARLSHLPASQVTVLHSAPALEDLRTPKSGTAPDLLLVEVPSLQSAQVEAVLAARVALRPAMTAVVYGFAARQTVAELSRGGVMALSAPADPQQLQRVFLLARGTAAPPTGGTDVRHFLGRPMPTRRYTDAQLSRLAVLDSAMKCECPQHVASLISQLAAFEKYSADCQNANARDAELHALLHATSAHARDLLEQVMGRVLEHEGLTI